MPESSYVKKSSVKNLITILVLGLLFLNMTIAYVVQDQAKEYAAKKAAALAIKQGRLDNAQDRYNISVQTYNANKAACGIRALVDLPKQKKILQTYIDAGKDKTLNEAAKARNAERVIATRSGIENGKKVIELFGTIPPDFDCSTLPEKPPVPPLPTLLPKSK